MTYSDRLQSYVEPIDPLSLLWDYPAISSEEENLRPDAYRDLGGQLSLPVALDGPELFLDAALALRENPRKQEIARGLGGLGLSVMTPRIFSGMAIESRRGYATALLHYKDYLTQRVAHFSTPVVSDGGKIAEIYGHHDDDWAVRYAGELATSGSQLSRAHILEGPGGAQGIINVYGPVEELRGSKSVHWNIGRAKDGTFRMYDNRKKTQSRRRSAA